MWWLNVSKAALNLANISILTILNVGLTNKLFWRPILYLFISWKGGAHIFYFYIYVELLNFRDIIKSVRLVCQRMGIFKKLLKKNGAKFDLCRYKRMAPKGRITVICASLRMIANTVKDHTVFFTISTKLVMILEIWTVLITVTNLLCSGHKFQGSSLWLIGSISRCMISQINPDQELLPVTVFLELFPLYL